MGIVRATTSFRAGAVFVRAGQLFDDGDNTIAGHKHLFEPVDASVRTTATVPGPVTAPPPNHPPAPERPAGNASKDDWRAYVTDLGGEPGELTRDELIALADDLEG